MPVCSLATYGMEVFKVFMISKNYNLFYCLHQKVSPFLKVVNYHYHLLIVNIIVEF